MSITSVRPDAAAPAASPRGKLGTGPDRVLRRSVPAPGRDQRFRPRLGGPFCVGSPIIDLPIVMPIRRSFLAISAARKIMFGMQQSTSSGRGSTDQPWSRGQPDEVEKLFVNEIRQ